MKTQPKCTRCGKTQRAAAHTRKVGPGVHAFTTAPRQPELNKVEKLVYTYLTDPTLLGTREEVRAAQDAISHYKSTPQGRSTLERIQWMLDHPHAAAGLRVRGEHGTFDL